MIAVASSLLVSCSAAQFSSDQCRLMKLMRVTTYGQCPVGIRTPVQVRSPHADEASYAPSLSPAINGGVNAGLGSGGADNVAGGMPGSGADGVGGPGAGGGSGAGDGDRPGGGGDGRPGGGGAPRPPNPPGVVIVKPGGGTITIKPDGDGKPPELDKEQKRRLALFLRNREQNDFVQPDRPKGKAKQGRNSR